MLARPQTPVKTASMRCGCPRVPSSDTAMGCTSQHPADWNEEDWLDRVGPATLPNQGPPWTAILGQLPMQLLISRVPEPLPAPGIACGVMSSSGSQDGEGPDPNLPYISWRQPLPPPARRRAAACMQLAVILQVTTECSECGLIHGIFCSKKRLAVLQGGEFMRVCDG